MLVPDLGDVLEISGYAVGTLIAFVLPAAFSFNLEGFTIDATVTLSVGGGVGLIGTAFSLRRLVLGG